MKSQISLLEKLLILVVGTVLFYSCERESHSGKFSNGAFIIDQGEKNSNTGSISFYSYSSDTVTDGIFYEVNNRNLEGFIESIGVNGDKAYILLSNTNKVEVVNKNTFYSERTISGISSPKDMVFSNGKGYISCWSENVVKVINLGTLSEEKSIPVSNGPEKLLAYNQNIFVACNAGNDSDSIISVIDTETDEVIDSIGVKYAPRDMVYDKNGFIWVLCFGRVTYDNLGRIIGETPSSLYKINSDSNRVDTKFRLFNRRHPTCLEIDKDGSTLYFGGGSEFKGVYGLIPEKNSLRADTIYAESINKLNYDPGSNVLFLTSRPDPTNSGILKRIDTKGNLLGTYNVGANPGNTVFK